MTKETGEDSTCVPLDGDEKSHSVESDQARNDMPRSLFKPCLILLAVCFFLGLYCCQLNQRLYQHRSPFYDSLSYNERMFGVMVKSKELGFFTALKTACNANSTNCLPFIICAAIAPVVEPSRMVGVWIQVGLLFFFLVSLLYYLSRIRGLTNHSALAGCLAFLVAKCLYFDNGGLSDFRMDLSLFLGFATTSVWFLSSMESPKRWHFVMMGIAASSVCLCRATAPIYLVFALTPLLIWELAKRENRKEKLAGTILATLIVVVMAGWFYALNFAYLKYYYFDWNTDANAKIPFAQALNHWNYAQRSVGEPFALMLICWGVAAMFRTAKLSAGSNSSSISNWFMQAIKHREIDWQLGWLAASAVLLMVGRRAGLNPFVSMPSVFGLVVFFTLPFLKQMDRLNHKGLKVFGWVILIGCILISCGRAWKRHSPDGFQMMPANHLVIDTMSDEANSNGQKLLHYGVTQITEFDANILYSTLLFNRPDGVRELDGVTIKGVKFKRIPTFSIPAVINWEEAAGDTDREKVAGLVATAKKRIHFLVVPDKETARRIPTTHAHNVVNRHAVAIRERIVNDDSWVLVKSGIQTGENEFVEVYRNELKR